MWENRNAYEILLGKPKGNKPLGRTRHRWVENVKIDFRGIEWGDVDCIDLAQDRGKWRALVNTATNFRVPLNAGKFLSRCTIGCFSRRAQLHEVS
jgi:glucose dehydrogenase